MMAKHPRQVDVDSSALERARRASGSGDDSTPKRPDPEVPSRPRRRSFTAAYKRQVLAENGPVAGARTDRGLPAP